jgi:hypothetical protein
MAEYIRSGTRIRDFQPDDTETELYIFSPRCGGGPTLEELLQRIKDKWPDARPESLTFSSQSIQTRCLGYDLYDSGDYDDFIVVALNGK